MQSQKRKEHSLDKPSISVLGGPGSAVTGIRTLNGLLIFD
jgi:hypothetical protein